MNFTSDDLKQIEYYFQQKGIKDSQFIPLSPPFTGEESCVIVKNNKNYKIKLKDILTLFIVDTELSSTSTNPVENRVLFDYINSLQNQIDELKESYKPTTIAAIIESVLYLYKDSMINNNTLVISNTRQVNINNNELIFINN